MPSSGLLHGISRDWHTNGQQRVEEHFVAGTLHGLRTEWHSNGQHSPRSLRAEAA